MPATRSRLVENPCVELAFCIELSPAKMHLVLVPIRLTMERFAMKKVAFLTLWGLFGIHIPFCPYRGVCSRDKSLAFEDSTNAFSFSLPCICSSFSPVLQNFNH